VNLQSAHDGGLASVLSRHEERVDSSFPTPTRDRQDARDRAQRPIQTQLAQKRTPTEIGRLDKTPGHQEAHGDREVERSALLTYIGRGKVNGRKAN
jgi:hypothetical protein